MKTTRVIVLAAVLAGISMFGAAFYSQAQATQTPPQTPTTQKPFEPSVGQAGKDVVWVPTPQVLVDKMLEMAKVTPQDYVIDLGSGDGRTVITAAKLSARAHGIEFNPDMVELSKRNAAAEGVSERATFVQADIFQSDFSKATVLTLFLLPDINLKLRPKILDMKPGTRVVSNSFTMDDWAADETATVTENCPSWCTAYLWIVPAKVAGAWGVGSDTLTLAQEFQEVSGTLGSTSITEGRLRGDEITFGVGTARYTGKVTATGMEGTVSGSRNGTWTARRQ